MRSPYPEFVLTNIICIEKALKGTQIAGLPWIWISMDIHGYPPKNGLDMDMDAIFHLHGKPVK